MAKNDTEKTAQKAPAKAKPQAEAKADKKKIEELTDKLAKEKDDYIRLMAEFETFRRRSAEERLNLVSNAAADTIKGLLPVLDDCERALEILSKSSDDAAKEGTQLIFDKLSEYLKSKGLTRIEAKGKDFDTDFHEAVTQFPAPSEDLNGKVIRYAKVVVGA